jgi:hypothetical protein
MRHLLSAVLGIVLSPLIYTIAGYAAVKVDQATGEGALDMVPAALGVVAAFTAGALYAILVMARLSPFGPILAGLLFLGVTLWALFNHDGFLATMQASVFGVRDVLHVPAGSGTALLAVPLLSTVFSPRRWRRTAGPGAPAYDAAPSYSATTPSAAPFYEPPVYETSSFSPPVYTPSTYQPATGDPATSEPATERPAGPPDAPRS